MLCLTLIIINVVYIADLICFFFFPVKTISLFPTFSVDLLLPCSLYLAEMRFPLILTKQQTHFKLLIKMFHMH